MDIFATADKIDNLVKEGAITGRANFPEKGTAILFAVETKSNAGQNFITFHLAEHSNTSLRGVFDVRIPLPTDKEAGQFLGMQRLYATLHASCKKNPKSDKVSDVYRGLESFLQKQHMHVEYEIQNRESFSQSTGKTYTNQDLVSLKHIAVVPHTGLTKPAPKAAAHSASGSSWGQSSGNSPWDKPQGGGYKAPAIDENVPF
jgi:hypothetical protein